MENETCIQPTIVDCGSSHSALEVPSTPSFVHSPGYQRVPSLQVTEMENLDNRRVTGGGPAYNTYDELDGSIEGLAISSLDLPSSRPISRLQSEGKSCVNPPDTASSLSETNVSQHIDLNDNGSFHDDSVPIRSSSFISSIHEPYEAVPDTERLYPTTPATITRSCDQQQPGTSFRCRSRRDIKRERGHWLSVTILMLAIYSTTFSAIWLVVAALKPCYGGFINTTTGRISPINASTLTAAFAKSIELSFVTVFVAFIGQVLGRRALVVRSKGITIAEMSTRHWVTQPGMMLTNFHCVKYAGNTPLGILSLTAVIVAVLYTTASDTLGEPIHLLVSLQLISPVCNSKTVFRWYAAVLSIGGLCCVFSTSIVRELTP